MISALISATVAFAVLIIAQWVIYWRERSRFLISKLEELYILLLDLGERNLQRFEPLMTAFASEFQYSPFASQHKLTHVSFAQVSMATKLSLDQIMAGDLLERISLLIDFYFPQLRSDLEKVFEANRKCIAILLIKAPPTYEEVRGASTGFADCKAVIERRILAERPVLAKTFTGKFRRWFEES
jgi:hypothetical protein